MLSIILCFEEGELAAETEKFIGMTALYAHRSCQMGNMCVFCVQKTSSMPNKCFYSLWLWNELIIRFVYCMSMTSRSTKKDSNLLSSTYVSPINSYVGNHKNAHRMALLVFSICNFGQLSYIFTTMQFALGFESEIQGHTNRS